MPRPVVQPAALVPLRELEPPRHRGPEEELGDVRYGTRRRVPVLLGARGATLGARYVYRAGASPRALPLDAGGTDAFGRPYTVTTRRAPAWPAGAARRPNLVPGITSLRGLGAGELLVLVDGEWTIAEGDWPVYQVWDPTLSANVGAPGDNAGCPPGYFCEYIAPGNAPTAIVQASPSAAYGTGYLRVCRRADQAVLNNPGAIAAESGPDLWDSTVINVAAVARESVETVKAAAAAALPTLSLGFLAVIAVAGVLALRALR
jgi:hypothetical protein